MIAQYNDYIESLARRLKCNIRTVLDVDDLKQAGVLGLILAVNTHNQKTPFDYWVKKNIYFTMVKEIEMMSQLKYYDRKIKNTKFSEVDVDDLDLQDDRYSEDALIDEIEYQEKSRLLTYCISELTKEEKEILLKKGNYYRKKKVLNKLKKLIQQGGKI